MFKRNVKNICLVVCDFYFPYLRNVYEMFCLLFIYHVYIVNRGTDVTNMLTLHRDALPADVSIVLRLSSNPLIASLFGHVEDPKKKAEAGDIKAKMAAVC